MPDAVSKAARYPLEDLLGTGGQGRTYRAKDLETQKPVAVKLIQLGGGEGWKSYDLFERECQALRSLSHPGIPAYLDTFALPEEGKYFLVMELIEGVTLDSLLREKRTFSEEELFAILRQMLDIIEYLHSRHPPVIHRDIKPANLMRRADGRVTLLDYGGVRIALRPEGGSTMVGTFGYMAPEQLHGAATAATDIYSLGATLAALATGTEADKLPRKGLKLDLGAVMHPSSLRALLEKMLEPDPDKRLSSVGELRALLPEHQAALPPPRQEGQMILAGAQPSALAQPLDEGLRDAPGAARTIIRVIGSLGYVGVFLLESLILPLLFAALGSGRAKNTMKWRKRKDKEEKILQMLGRGRKRFKALAEGRNPNRSHPGLPALPPPPTAPRALPGIEQRESQPVQRSSRRRR